MKGVVFLISFSVHLSLVCRRATDFLWVNFLSWYFAKTIYQLWKFPSGTFGSLTYFIISSANQDSLTSSFPIGNPLLSFSCLIALAKTSSLLVFIR